MLRGLIRRRRAERALRRVVDGPAAVVPPVERAQALLEQGRPDEAAGLLLSSASAADSAGHAKQAANLNAMAAHALVAANDEDGALSAAEAALERFQRLGMQERATTFRRNITARMQGAGMDKAASHLGSPSTAPGKAAAAEAATAQPASSRGRLPAKCPHCGGPVRSDDVDWIDAHSAECDYCGGVVTTLN